eukprot:GEMP01074081.1.p1 GENE.GEMP01074081.1~~GEMP01074081.1.p1  ORF type:complete len:336 (+),score=37.86 GEMP01074081.1:125-1132(+)
MGLSNSKKYDDAVRCLREQDPEHIMCQKPGILGWGDSFFGVASHLQCASHSDYVTAREAIATCIGKSFSGSDRTAPEGCLHWMIGPELADLSDPHREQAVTFIMRWPVTQHSVLPANGIVLTCPYSTDGLTGNVCDDVQGSTAPGKDRAMVEPGVNYQHSNSPDSYGAVAVIRYYGSGFEGPLVFEETRCHWSIMATPTVLAALPDLVQKANWKESLKRCEARAKKVLALTRDLHEKHASSPHFYLSTLAVHPDMQGKGLGGKLLRALNQAADRARIPCYLETTGERNVAIYQKYGYKVMENVRLEIEADVDTWPASILTTMLREPQGPAPGASS